MRRWLRWVRRSAPPLVDHSLSASVARIESDLTQHASAFRAYVLTTDIRLELIDVLTTKVLPEIAKALRDNAESQRKLNDTFDRVLAALPPTPAQREEHKRMLHTDRSA